MPMAAKLTAIGVERAKPLKRDGGALIRTEIADGGCPGLYLVVQPSGAKSWAVRYRFAGAPKKLTLGPVLLLGADEREPADPKIGDPLTLAAARKLAKAELHKLEFGVDPAKAKQDEIGARREVAAVRAGDTVENLAEQFIERYCKPKGNRTWTRTKAYFDKEVLQRWRGKTVHEITTEDVEDLIDAIAEDRPIAANRVLAAVRKWFAWMGGKYKGGKKAVLKCRLRTAPCVGIEAPGEEKKRDRVLADAEIKALWAACDKGEPDGGGGIGEPFGSFIKILLLTGQRRAEVAGMKWSEIDKHKGVWSIPGERTKNKLPHVVPLSTQALSIVEAVKPIAGAGFVFTTTGDSSVGGFSRAKNRIDKKMRSAERWALHDLRRSCATGMANIGVQPHVVEAVLNHVSGHRAGVAGVYNRAAYTAEKADALQRWADHVEGLVTGKPAAEVIPIHGWRR
jgi:integrase